jgi:hypothetical protein
MQCVQFSGAMKIDIWRILVIYRYGGIYTDIDNWPGEKFDKDTIPDDISAFFLSDVWNRPSQWFFAMESYHPIAYYCMNEILHRVLYLDDISKPKVVFVTGPDALKHAYGRFLNWQPKDKIFGGGTFTGKLFKQVQKIEKRQSGKYVIGSLGGTFNDIVWSNATMKVTTRDKVEKENGVVHWLKDVRQRSRKVRGGSCMDYLYSLEDRNEDTILDADQLKEASVVETSKINESAVRFVYPTPFPF